MAKTTDAQIYFDNFSDVLKSINLDEYQFGMDLVKQAWLRGGNVITMGNGGSALTAIHFINDWNKSIYLASKIPFMGRSLVDNVGLIMSYGNDFSFEEIFVEQLKNILKPNDLVIAISGSGNSENIIRAVRYADEKNIETLGLCGYDGGKLKQCARHSVWVKSFDMQLVEDFHSMFGHMTMQYLCQHSDT